MPIRALLVNTRRPLMSNEPPTPSAELLTDVVNKLTAYTVGQLQHVARYAEELAGHKAREANLEEETPRMRATSGRTTSHQRQLSRSRRSMKTATTIGSGGRATGWNRSTKDRSTRTS